MKKHTFFIAVLGLFSSCESVLLEEELVTTDPYINFEYLWNECDENYSYFTLKNVDWNAVKLEYEAKLYEGMTQDSLFNVFEAMLNELKDNHVNLVSDVRTSFYGTQYQAQDNFDWRIIVDNYITTSYQITGPFRHNYIANNQIAYVRLESFSNPIEDAHLDYILSNYQNTEGMILDLRGNGGGKIEHSYKLLRRLIEEETLVNYTRIKAGQEHDNFSLPEPVRVKPYNGIRYTKNIAVLIDGGSYSATSLFALNTKAFPHIKLVGDATGGGLGMPNGGQLPNGWYYRFSVTQTLDLQQSPDNENGVPPDISATLNLTDRSRDEIIDIALSNGVNGLLD
jgi:hypothetical protein